MPKAKPLLVLLPLAIACGGGDDAAAPGENQPPTAVFNSQCGGLTCNFLNFSKDSDGDIVAWSWDFGDGATGTGPTPAHVYAEVKSYQVTLTVTDNDGATASVTRTARTTTPTTRTINITLPQAAGFTATLTAAATCEAHGNTFRLLSPVNSTLTTDACYDQVGKSLSFPGPFTAGTVIEAEIVAPPLAGPPDYRIVGGYPSWRIEFEDGVDSDYDDVVITITATP